MSWWRRTRTREAEPRRTDLVDADLVAWAEVAGPLADRLAPAGAFAVALLGESLVRPRPSAWFGYEPDAPGLDALLAELGEPDVDVSALLAAEGPLAGRHLGTVPPDLSDAWRTRLSASAQHARAAGLPTRATAHRDAESVWVTAAAAASAPPMVVLDPACALSQLRWFPGVATTTFIGYSDPLNLSTVQRATGEAGLTAAQRQAQDAARQVVDQPVDPLAWRLSSLAFAADHRPWERR